MAIALPGNQTSLQGGNTPVGLLDANGMVMPLERYTALNQSLKLPELKILGDQQQYLSAWSSFYQAASRSPVKITAVDWRDPSNLILKTELGMVYLGSYSAQFPQQLKTLDRMRRLPRYLKSTDVLYIDLRKPDLPVIQTTKGAAVKPSPP